MDSAQKKLSVDQEAQRSQLQADLQEILKKKLEKVKIQLEASEAKHKKFKTSIEKQLSDIVD
jgi:flagellar hook-basal body complex protein FliE